MLSQIQGVHLIRRGNFAWEPTIRGLNGGQINTTIDGMFIFGACTDKMDPVSSYVEPANLHQVQVAYGPNAQEAGSGIGGGFNFQLLKARPDSGFYTHGTLALGLESNAPAMQTIATLQMGDKRWAVGANAVFRKGGNYSMGGGKEVDFSQYSKWNAGINTTYQLSKHHQLTAAYLQDEGYNIGYPALTMDVAFAKAKIASLTHTYICGHRSLYRWENKVYYNFIDHAMDDTKRPQHLVPMHMDMPGKSRTIGADSKAALRLNDHSVFNVQLNA